MSNALLFPIIFLFFSSIVLWIVIGCKGWWQAKFWLINISFILVFVLWTTIISHMGWGYPSSLPDKFRLLGYHSDEPKNLYILVGIEEEKKFNWKEILNYKSDDVTRLYKINYNKKMHQQLDAAMERVQRGGIVFGSKTRILEAEEINGMQNLESNVSGTPTDENHNFYIFPPSKMFQKPNN